MFPIGDQNEPGRGLPIITLALIGLNVAVFLLLQDAGGETAFTYGWSAIPREVTTGVDLLRATPITINGQDFLLPQAPSRSQTGTGWSNPRCGRGTTSSGRRRTSISRRLNG